MLLKINTSINDKSRSLITSASNAGGLFPQLHLGDQHNVRIELWEEDVRQTIDPASTFVLAIGNSTLPTGDFNFTYKGETTGFIKASASIDTIESELNKLSTITTDGGVAVTGSLAVLQIKFRTEGEKGLISLNTDDLSPSGNGTVSAVDVDNITQVAYVSQGLIEHITDFTPVMDGSDIVGLDCIVDLNTLAAALSFGSAEEINRTVQFAETLTGNRTTHLKINARINSDLVTPANLIEGLISTDYITQFYLGESATNPTTSLSGGALLDGMFYYNTVDEVFKFYTGTEWISPFFDVAAVDERVRQVIASSSTLSVVADQVTVDLDIAVYTHELTINDDVEFLLTGAASQYKTVFITATANSTLTFPVGLNWLSLQPDPSSIEAGQKAVFFAISDPSGGYWVSYNLANEEE